MQYLFTAIYVISAFACIFWAFFIMDRECNNGILDDFLVVVIGGFFCFPIINTLVAIGITAQYFEVKQKRKSKI